MKYPLASRSGTTLIVWMLHAYQEWTALTKAQRSALTTREGRPAVLGRLEQKGLWDADGPTPWGQFVVDVRTQDGLSRYTIGDDGELLRVVPQ